MQFRYAVRTLARTPGFVFVAALTLALGIGINTVVFTIYQSVSLKPLAVRAPGQMVRVSGRYDGPPSYEFSYAEYERLRDESRAMAGAIASSLPQSILCVPPEANRPAEIVRARFVSEDYFQALGVVPPLGRAFTAGEQSAAVVSHRFWQNRLGSDPGVVGRTMLLQGVAVTILGVAPEKFAGTGLPAEVPDLWVPIASQPAILRGVDWIHDDSARQFQVLARRAPGVTLDQVSAELKVLGAAWPPVNGHRIQLSSQPATFFQTDSGEFETFGTVVRVLAVAVAMILLIGCVNLVNLLLARNSARQREIAVRLALGASRGRLVRLLSLESVLLGLCGGAGGLLFSLWACDWISATAARLLQQTFGGAIRVFLDFSPDWQVFAYTLVLSVLTGIAVGIWPAVRAAGCDVNDALKQEAGRMFGSRPGGGVRSLLLSAQVAACLVLLAGAGLLFRGVWRAREVNPGFETGHLFVLGTDPKAIAATPAARATLLRQVGDRLTALPDVVSAAWTDRPPFLGHGSSAFQNEQKILVQSLFAGVSERYFETLGIPVLEGRTFTPAEIEQEAPVAVISESGARRFWPGQDPLGKRVLVPKWLRRLMKHEAYTVIGVARSVRSTYLSKPDEAFLYFPIAPPVNYGLMLVRTRVAPRATFTSAIAALAAIHPNLPSQTNLVTLEEGPVALQRLMAEGPAAVASVLGLLALLLASVGIYGVASYMVAQRTREIGIRMALGARTADVIRTILGQSLRPVAWGAAAGLLGAFGVSALLRATVVIPDVPDFTYGAGAFHPATFLAVVAVLAVVVLVATFVPLRRATRIQPVEALREE